MCRWRRMALAAIWVSATIGCVSARPHNSPNAQPLPHQPCSDPDVGCASPESCVDAFLESVSWMPDSAACSDEVWNRLLGFGTRAIPALAQHLEEYELRGADNPEYALQPCPQPAQHVHDALFSTGEEGVRFLSEYQGKGAFRALAEFVLRSDYASSALPLLEARMGTREAAQWLRSRCLKPFNPRIQILAIASNSYQFHGRWIETIARAPSCRVRPSNEPSNEPCVTAARGAVTALGYMGDERAIPAIIDAIAVGDWYLTESAINSLANIGHGDPAVSAALTKLERTHWCPNIRCTAARTREWLEHGVAHSADIRACVLSNAKIGYQCFRDAFSRRNVPGLNACPPHGREDYYDLPPLCMPK